MHRHLVRVALLLASVSLLACLLAAGAPARVAYVADYKGEAVRAIDLGTNQPIGAPIQSGSGNGPFSLAITPDGKTVYVVNYDGAGLAGLDTATNLFLGAPIPITQFSFGFGITPDGTRAYVANTETGTVEAIDLATRARIGAPIPVGEGPDAITITPDGSRVYVSNNDTDDVSVIDTATNQVVGTPIKVGSGPYVSAITPDGRFVLVPDLTGVSIIDTATNQVVPPAIPIGEAGGSAIAISPDGTRAYVAGEEPNTITVVDIPGRTVIGSPIPIPLEIEYLAVTPDGRRLLVEQADTVVGPGQISIVDTATNQIAGPPIVCCEGDGQVAVVPDQGPIAGFAGQGRARPGVPYLLDGGASTDSDGTVAGWSWAFGDGATAIETVATTKHVFKKPGRFAVSLTVTDNEGCSAALVFTGQTASCNSSPGAVVTNSVKVAYPGVKVRCPSRSKSACKFKLRAVQRKKGKLKAMSAAARGKARPGKSAVFSLKPKRKFATKLAAARKALVEVTVTTSGQRKTIVKKLKVVR
jgi:YVTN family beta-propeller protein